MTLYVAATTAAGDAVTTSAAIGAPDHLEPPTASGSRFRAHTIYTVIAESGEVVDVGLFPPRPCPYHEDMMLLAARTGEVENVLWEVWLEVRRAHGAIAKLIAVIQSEPPDRIVLSQWRTIHNDWTGPGGSGVDPDGGDLDGDGDADLRDVWLWRPQRAEPDRR